MAAPRVGCEFCVKTFATGEGCVKHMKKTHGKTLAEVQLTVANGCARQEAAMRKKAKYTPKARVASPAPSMTRREAMSLMAGQDTSHVFCMFCAKDIHKRMVVPHFENQHRDFQTNVELSKWIAVQDGRRMANRSQVEMKFEPAMLEWDYQNLRSSQEDSQSAEDMHLSLNFFFRVAFA